RTPDDEGHPAFFCGAMGDVLRATRSVLFWCSLHGAARGRAYFAFFAYRAVLLLAITNLNFSLSPKRDIHFAIHVVQSPHPVTSEDQNQILGGFPQ
ncbi:MAG: hypothetical protein RSC91_06725, partial [Clostridia bacterium]